MAGSLKFLLYRQGRGFSDVVGPSQRDPVCQWQNPIKTWSSWLSDQVCPLLRSPTHTCPSSFVFPGVDTCQLCKVRCSGASGSLSGSYGTPGPLCREARSLWKPPRGLQPQGLAVLCRTCSLPNYPCPATRKLPPMLESGRASALWTRL